MFRFLVLATLGAGGALLGPSRAAAHALSATLDTSGDPFKLLAFFEEDIPAEFADVTVTDADGNVVLTGRTDDRGAWAFPRPKPGTYKLTVRSVGHVAARDFAVAGAAEPTVAGPTAAEPAGWRPGKWAGLSIGVGALLGVSGLSWLLRRRGRRLE